MPLLAKAQGTKTESSRPPVIMIPSRLDVQHLSKTYLAAGRHVPALRDLSLEVGAEDFVAVVGPSGCGKTTLLRILAGLEQPDAGHLVVDGEERHLKPGHLAFMPQRESLLPWKGVLDNVALGLRLSGVTTEEARQRALSLFDRFGLTGFENHYPGTLSGGMRQRAVLLRTFLTGNDVLLLDEPFGALDALTRVDLQGWLSDVCREFGKTVLLVTHDVDEALYLADRVYVLSPRPGRVRSVIKVDVPSPRPYRQTVTSPRFAALKASVLEALSSP